MGGSEKLGVLRMSENFVHDDPLSRKDEAQARRCTCARRSHRTPSA